MKKYLLFVITILVTGLDIHAQNTFPASGKVGIGTTSPLTLLHVKGVGSFGANITTANSTRVLNLADANAVMRILRVHPTNAPAIELLSRTSADGANVAYWDMYAEPSDKSFRIRDRVTGSNLDRFTINNTGNVGIGTVTPSYPLNVNSATASAVIYATNTYNGAVDKTAIFGYSVNTPGYGYGIQGYGGHTGVYGDANARQGNYKGDIMGVHGYAANDENLGFVYGVYGESNGGVQGVGVYGVGWSSNELDFVGESYGGYFEGKGNISTGIFAEGGSAAGYFNGNIFAANTFAPSDRKLKKGIAPMQHALANLMKLNPASYEFKIEEYKGMVLPKGKQMGLIADELKQVFPELVQKAVKPARYDEKDRTKVIDPEVEYEAVNYQGLIPVLVASVQELNKKNDALVAENSELKERLARIETMLTSGNGTLSPSSAYLENATPNPSRGTTAIRYQLPDGTTSARLTLVNAKGQVLKEVNLAGRGSGQVNLSTSNLPAGVYTYSLWIDGQQAATRKLVSAR